MIIIDESKLTHNTIALIGRDYGMEYDYENYEVETYEAFVKSVIERFDFNVDDFKDKILRIVKENLKVELKFVDGK